MKTPWARDANWPHRFRDRAEAGAALASALGRFAGPETLVLGLPRGGVPVAAEVARHLGAELDIVVARKLGSPVSPEVAVGAITADGVRVLNEGIIDALGVSGEYLESVGLREATEARRREQLFRGGRPAPTITGRVVVVVDDGLATGSTMRAALRSVRRQHPARLVAAVPVGPPGTAQDLRGDVDEVVCLQTPPGFRAVGEYYDDFRQVSDAEVLEILGEAPRSSERKTAPRWTGGQSDGPGRS